MKIRLKSWKIVSMSFTQRDGEADERESSFDLESGNYFSEDEESNNFGVGFKADIKDNDFDFEIEALYDFEIVGDKITEEFKLSSFPKVNAPAIAFPYLRSFISIVTLQAGYDPVMLPSINFTKPSSDDSDTEIE